jgi:hypothetical protein
LGLKRDPSAFYWKPKRPATPQSSFSLECGQWRHATGDEFFDGWIYVRENAKAISGALECRIHAENLSEPASKQVPVRIEIKRVSIYDRGVNLVEWLTG